jgi:8-oxo-dGTP diphosphatase
MNPPAARRRIAVVAAVLQQPDGRFLLAQRPQGKVYAGYWEFPGGKVEPGETPLQALARELHEELGIEVTTAYPWLIREFDYEHANVGCIFRVAWRGEPHGRGAGVCWQRIDTIRAAAAGERPHPHALAFQKPTALPDSQRRNRSALRIDPRCAAVCG